MRDTISYVTQSKFFSPAFNAAIFDGPIRIYFAQYQEPQALKLYFYLQQRFSELRRQARGIFKNRERNIFVMLYPNVETFDLSFGEHQPEPTGMGAEAGATRGLILSESLGEDYVIGVRGPLPDHYFEDLCEQMDAIVRGHEETTLLHQPEL